MTFLAEGQRRLTISYSTLAVLIASVAVLLAVAFSAGRRYEVSHPSAVGKAELAQGEPSDAETGTPDESGAVDDASETGQARKPSLAGQPTPGQMDASEPGSTRDRPPQVALREGYHYVVVQHFGKRRQDAEDTATYLHEHGVLCAMRLGKDIRVIATQPFLIKQSDRAAAERERQKANQLIQEIKRIGKEYEKYRRQQGKGTYTLDGAYLLEIR